MELPVYNEHGKQTGTIALDDRVFGQRWNAALMHQVAETYRANRRRHTVSVKDRGEVRGGGKKPWRQKGTGRARHGSIRSPLWIGGGVTHGPRREKQYAKKLNNAMRKKALGIALSQRIRDGRMVVVESIRLPEEKTRAAKNFIAILRRIGAQDAAPMRALLLLPAEAKTDARAFRNVRGVTTMPDRLANTFAVLSHPAIYLSRESAETLTALAAARSRSTARA